MLRLFLIAVGVLFSFATLPMMFVTVDTLFSTSVSKEDFAMGAIVTTVMLTVTIGIFLIVRRLPDRSPAVHFTKRRVFLEGFSCSGCGGNEFIRQDGNLRAAMSGRMRIRCTGCGNKYFSSPKLWVLLPPARLDDRFLDADDENAIAAQAPLSALQVLTCLIGLAVGVTPAILYMIFVDMGEGAGSALYWIGMVAACSMMRLPIRMAWRYSLRYSPVWMTKGGGAPADRADADLSDPKA